MTKALTYDVVHQVGAFLLEKNRYRQNKAKIKQKGGNVMPKFIPLTMLKDTTGIVEFCQECGEPVFVTRNGTPEMVIMDAAFFDEYLRYRTEDGRLDIRKEFATIPEAITIKELKNTGEVSALCAQTNEPVNIIRNGYAVLVIISAEGYKKRHAELWESHR